LPNQQSAEARRAAIVSCYRAISVFDANGVRSICG
jgi:hypothetical protein